MATHNFKTCSVLLVLLFLANSGISARVLLMDTQDQNPSSESESEPELLSQTYSSGADGLQTNSGETTEDGNLSQENTYIPSDDVKPTAPNSSPSYASDASSLDKTEDENDSSVSPALSPVQEDSPATETEKSNDLFQENTFLPPSPVYIGSPAPEITPENSAFPGNVNSPAFSPSYPASSPLESITNGGSFYDQEQNQYNSPIANSPAPETNPEKEISSEDPFSSAPTPSNSGITENPETDNVPDLNDYTSIPKSAAPAPETALPFPLTETEPTNDDLASPTNYHQILPSTYRAEDESVGAYEEEDESSGGMNKAVLGVMMGVCFVGVGGWVYKKRKNDVRAQYHSLAKKEGV